MNVPAVSGTGILAALQEARAAGITSKEEFFAMAEETGIKKEEDAVANPQLQETAAPQTGAPSTGWEDVLRAAGTDALLNASGLSAPARDLVRSSLGDSFEPDDVTAGIERVRAVLAKERDANVVQGIHPITAGDMQDGLDRFKLDFDWVMGVPDVRMPDPRSRSLRDQYLALTGDYGFHGKFDPEQAQLANANSSTFAGVVLDAMNRIVEHHYQNEMMYRWFEQFVDVTPHDGSTHPIKMVTVDGIANLPVVSEGGSYTEAVVGDAKEEMNFSKRGSYVGITIETLMQNNIVRARSIPANLVISSIRTRSAAIGYLFTQASGVGPTLAQDTKALFHADHGNLSTAAFADASWRAMRSQMFKQTVPGTGKPFATWPRYCLVPVDLYDRALVQFGYGSGDVGKPNGAGTSQEVNPYGEARPGDPRPIPIAVPEFTDTNDWAAVVEMSMFAPIKMAYAMSPGGGMHPLVELYEAESPNGGLMFTNDTLPIKARDWWAYGVSSHIGVAKANV